MKLKKTSAEASRVPIPHTFWLTLPCLGSSEKEVVFTADSTAQTKPQWITDTPDLHVKSATAVLYSSFPPLHPAPPHLSSVACLCGSEAVRSVDSNDSNSIHVWHSRSEQYSTEESSREYRAMNQQLLYCISRFQGRQTRQKHNYKAWTRPNMNSCREFVYTSVS